MPESRLPFETVCRALYAVAGLSLLLILVLMIGRVASRNLDLGWSGLQIIAQFFEVWLAFLVVGALAYERGHIEIDYLSQRLPRAGSRSTTSSSASSAWPPGSSSCSGRCAR